MLFSFGIRMRQLSEKCVESGKRYFVPYSETEALPTGYCCLTDTDKQKCMETVGLSRHKKVDYPQTKLN